VRLVLWDRVRKHLEGFQSTWQTRALGGGKHHPATRAADRVGTRTRRRRREPAQRGKRVRRGGPSARAPGAGPRRVRGRARRADRAARAGAAGDGGQRMGRERVRGRAAATRSSPRTWVSGRTWRGRPSRMLSRAGGAHMRERTMGRRTVDEYSARSECVATASCALRRREGHVSRGALGEGGPGERREFRRGRALGTLDPAGSADTHVHPACVELGDERDKVRRDLGEVPRQLLFAEPSHRMLRDHALVHVERDSLHACRQRVG